MEKTKKKMDMIKKSMKMMKVKKRTITASSNNREDD